MYLVVAVTAKCRRLLIVREYQDDIWLFAHTCLVKRMRGGYVKEKNLALIAMIVLIIAVPSAAKFLPELASR